MNSGTIIPLYRRPVSKTPTPVYLAQPILLLPFSETNVPVTTDNEGTCLIQAVTANRTFQKRNYATAPGISDIKNSQAFMIKVANYGKKPILLQKHTTTGISTTLSAEVLTFSETSAEPSDQRGETGHDSDWKEELKIDHLSGNDQEEVVKMLSKHSSMWTGSLGEISITEHHIQLQSDAEPVYQPPYRAGVKAREVEKAEVDRMLTAGVIEPAVSEWASPVVLITKPDGSVRFCVDYRKLNALTIKDS
jgi:hypothetical protein